MASCNRLWRRSAAILPFGTLVAAQSIPMNYCASINTASTPANASIYQSDGLCHDFCKPGGNAFAIVQGKDCWCSNVLPDDSVQVSVSQCNSKCPGFPTDVCGGDGLWGYMALGPSPTSTLGASPSDSSSVASTTSPTSLASTQWTTLAPTVQTVTAGGTIKTVTVTPTVAVGSANNNGMSASSSGLSTGSAVGLAVGVVALVAIVVGGLLFFCLRRRRRREEENDMPSPWRNSSTGMMSITPKTEMSEKGPGGRPVPENWETDELGRRRSRLMPVDPRMNFGTGIYAREENVSHDSINTVRDDQDYSRRVHEPPKVLRATNPDPLDD